jgi:hypothetical protein
VENRANWLMDDLERLREQIAAVDRTVLGGAQRPL